MDKLPISVILLTYDDEKIIEEALKSVEGWVENIFAVDSGSTDRTLEIVKKYTSNVYNHPFESYGVHRNWTLDNIPATTEWILPLDSDQRVTPELKDELFRLFSKGIDPTTNGFIAKTKTVFMGRWIKHGGHYPIYRVYLIRKGRARWEERKYHQHCVVEGQTGKLDEDMIDVITSNIDTFADRINRWSTSEAGEILEGGSEGQVGAKLLGSHIERKRWLRTKFFWNLPLFSRTFAYFFYRYILRLGFLDGIEGAIFHFIQGFYMHFITDAKVFELREKLKKRSDKP